MCYCGSPYNKRQQKVLYTSNHKLPGGLESTHTIIALLDSELNTVGPYREDDGDDDDDDNDDDNNNNYYSKATNQQIYLQNMCVSNRRHYSLQ
jgi:hypothetical protein